MTAFQSKIDAVVSWKLWEKLFLAFELFLIPILFLILFFDFQRRLDAGGREQIGIISFKQKTVQRKYGDRVVWEGMEASFPLYNRDSIRTGDLSDAEITLTDGTKLEIDENSLIVLNITKEEKEIDFAYGTLSANSSSNDSGEAIKIKSGETVVALDKSDVSLKQNEDKSLILDVKSGVASLFQNGKENLINNGEKAVLSDQETKITKNPLKVISPSSNLKLASANAITDVEFAFEGLESADKNFLEIYKDRKFTQIFKKRSISSNKLTESFPEGTYYWRIYSNGNVGSSGKISNLQIKSAQLVSPNNNKKYFATKEQTLVAFSWVSQNEFNQSIVEVSSDPEFSKLVSERGTLGKSISMELPQGNYFWRVKSIINSSSNPIYSAVQRFEITNDEPSKAPNLLYPKPNDSIPETVANINGLKFIWTEIKGYKHYNLEIANNANFKEPKIFNSIVSTSFQFKDKISSGNYFWRITGITPSGKSGDPSKPNSFSIKALEGNIFSLQAVSSISKIKMQKEGLLLKWKKLPIQGIYKVEIGKDSEFKDVVKTLTTSISQVSFNDIQIGTFFWRVSLTDESGNSSYVSESRSISIFDSSGPIYPQKDQVINMSNKENIVFSWSAQANIKNYTIQIYQLIGAQKILLLQKSTNTNSFIMDELSLLDEGKFNWQILVENPSTSEKTVEFSSNFSISLDKLPEKIELLTPKVQYAD